MLDKQEAQYEKVILIGLITKDQDEVKSAEYLDELAFLAILTLARSCLMPFFTHFGFVIFMDILFVIELVISVSIRALVIKFAFVIVHPVFAKFCFVVKSKVFNVLNHLFT